MGTELLVFIVIGFLVGMGIKALFEPSQPTPAQVAKPGWYPDPKDETKLRYWDGVWTDHTADKN